VINRASCLIAWIALAACGGSSKPSAQPPPQPPPAAPTPVEKAGPEESCLQAVDALFAITAAAEPPELRARASKVFVHRCETDHWSAEIRHCMVGIKAAADGDGCEAMLTPAQSRELRDELSRELDAAGVKPETASGKPKAAAPKGAMPKEDAKKEAAPKKKARSKSGDPCQGGE
jgi:hypothetical protein